MNQENILPFCSSLFEYERFETHSVKVGKLQIGGDSPVLVQSMVNTDTMDTKATVFQTRELYEEGCHLVRITAPGIKEAKNLRNIKAQLEKDGVEVTLVADIHFAPKAADLAATIVDKVRINPGNYVDKKMFKAFEYTDKSYNKEIEKIESKLIPFLDICRKHQTAIRIGSNHGSLSDRIVNRYGNTPEGMVEAAMEYLRICQEQDFSNVVVSMKASNTQIMTQSTRLLVAKMRNENMSFPVHLGVTEAGNGEEARIKSAMGIGALLADGIGDTVRVSLTEYPVKEIPVAKTIINHYNSYQSDKTRYCNLELKLNPYRFQKRSSSNLDFVGGNNTPIVVVNQDESLSKKNDADLIYSETVLSDMGNNKYLLPYTVYQGAQNLKNVYPLFSVSQWIGIKNKQNWVSFISCEFDDLPNLVDSIVGHSVVLVINSKQINSISEFRACFAVLKDIDCPVVLRKGYSQLKDLSIKGACDLGPLFIDGFGDGVWIESNQNESQNLQLGLNILQAARVRMSKTEFISCPSCGRTLFELEETTLVIKKKLSHLKHLKIGIMGCIVNGPGEMADADYGYVGSGVGKVSLYKGQKVVRRNILSEEALGEMIAIIKENGDWVEPSFEK